MAAVLLHTLDMLGGGSCNGVKVLKEYCLLCRKSWRGKVKSIIYFYVRQWIEIAYVKVL